jgi:hypothetical protein
VNGLRVRATGAEDIVRPWRLIGRSWAPLNFTVRGQPAPASAPI